MTALVNAVFSLLLMEEGTHFPMLINLLWLSDNATEGTLI